MSQVKIQGGASGSDNYTILAPATSTGDKTLTLPTATATLASTDANTFTGVQTFPAGSASAPSITTTGDTNTGVFFPAADTVGVATGGAEAARINSSGTLILKGGSTSATGVGITFPADTTTTVSSNANTLDDYEEGTFTPTISSGYSVAPSAYEIQNGSYVKVGRFVHFQFVIAASGATANGSHLKFGGLPFTPGKQGSAVYAYQIGFNTNTGDTYAVETSNTTINAYTNAGAQRAGNAAGINLNTRIDLCGFYQV